MSNINKKFPYLYGRPKLDVLMPCFSCSGKGTTGMLFWKKPCQVCHGTGRVLRYSQKSNSLLPYNSLKIQCNGHNRPKVPSKLTSWQVPPPQKSNSLLPYNSLKIQYNGHNRPKVPSKLTSWQVPPPWHPSYPHPGHPMHPRSLSNPNNPNSPLNQNNNPFGPG